MTTSVYTTNTTSPNILTVGTAIPNQAPWTITTGTAPGSAIVTHEQLEKLEKRMEKIEERLLILVPKPEMLEKFESLRNAYEQYKLMEALCK